MKATVQRLPADAKELPAGSAPAGTMPGVNQRLLVARSNMDASLIEFETNIRNLVSDVQAAYWDLYLDYGTLESAAKGRDDSLQVWQKVYTSKNAADEAKAREQYFAFRSTTDRAESQFNTTEGKLRKLLGIAAGDGRLFRAADDPPTAKIRVDWREANSEAMSRSPEIRSARLRVKREELELKAFEQNALSHKQPVDAANNAATALARERVKLHEAELEASHQLFSAVSDMEATFMLVEANSNRRSAAQRALEAVTKAWENGSVNVGDLLAAQRTLPQANRDYLRATANYAKSIARVHFCKGTLLEYYGIHLAEAPEHDAAAEAIGRDANDPSGKTSAAGPVKGSTGSTAIPRTDPKTASDPNDQYASGVVVDEDNQAIEGAEVRIYETSYAPQTEHLLRTALTSAQGNFRLERPLANKPVSMTISKPRLCLIRNGLR